MCSAGKCVHGYWILRDLNSALCAPENNSITPLWCTVLPGLKELVSDLVAGEFVRS